MEIKLCKDCRHVSHKNKKCLHEAVGMWSVDPYDGTKTWLAPSVTVARTIGDCGSAGRLWEVAAV